MASALTYRVYCLRRLIVVCLVLVALAVGLGLWLVPGASPLQTVFGMGLFSIFAMAQLAMILMWPRDMVGPLTYAVGLIPFLAMALPGGHALNLSQGTDGLALVLGLLFGPLAWLIVVPALGWLMLKPLDHLTRRNFRATASQLLPMPVAAARDMFFARPHKTRRDSVTGPVEWDGFFTETVTNQIAGPGSGEISRETMTVRMRILDENAQSQGILAQFPGSAVYGAGTVVMTQTLTPLGDTTRIDRAFHIDRAPWSAVLTGWLGDIQHDSITALQDEALDTPPRAISEEPLDSLWASLSRWLRWHEPSP